MTGAEPSSRWFHEVLEVTAARVKFRCLFVPLPFAPALTAVRMIERLGWPAPLRSESLLGMKGLRAAPVEGDLARLGVRVRGVEESLAAIFSGDIL